MNGGAGIADGYPVGQTLSFQVGPMTIEHEIVSGSRFSARHLAGPMTGMAETMRRVR